MLFLLREFAENDARDSQASPSYLVFNDSIIYSTNTSHEHHQQYRVL